MRSKYQLQDRVQTEKLKQFHPQTALRIHQYSNLKVSNLMTRRKKNRSSLFLFFLIALPILCSRTAEKLLPILYFQPNLSPIPYHP